MKLLIATLILIIVHLFTRNTMNDTPKFKKIMDIYIITVSAFNIGISVEKLFNLL